MKSNSEQKQTIYNLTASFLIGGITFLTAPVFTRMLGPEQYGLFSVAYSWTTILVCVMGFQTKEALARGHLDFQDDYQRFRNSTLLLSLLISAAEILIILAFINPISRFLGYSYKLLFIILLTAFARYIFLFNEQSFIFEKKAQINLILSVLLVISIVVLSVWFIKYLGGDKKYIGRLLGFTLPYTVFAIGGCCYFALENRFSININYWKYSLAFGLPIVFHALSKEILGQTDKVMMNQLHVDTAEIGIYSFFLAMAGALGMIRDALNTSWRPFYYDYLYNGEKSLLEQKCNNYIELFTVVTCIFMMAAKEVSLIMAGEEYQSGLSVLPVIAWCIYFSFIHQFPVDFELYCKKTRIVAAGTVAAAVINIILNAALIPRWGIYGAGAATAASYFCLAAGHLFVASHLKEQRYHLSILSFLPGICFLVCCTVLFYALDKLWIVRWSIAAIAGLFELTKIIKRKTVF